MTEGDTPRAPDAVWTLGVPVLGICYGMQTMAAQLGGAVEPGRVREFGYAEVRARGHSTLLARHRGSPQRGGPRPARRLDEPRRQGHRVAAGIHDDRGVSDACAIAAMADPSARASTPCSSIRRSRTRSRALRSSRASRTTSAAAAQDWNMATTSDEAVAAIRAQVGSDEVILGLSGGVDSSVAAALHPQGDRRPAHLRVRRPRAAAPGRGRRR